MEAPCGHGVEADLYHGAWLGADGSPGEVRGRFAESPPPKVVRRKSIRT
jgi:hypothetical protein